MQNTIKIAIIGFGNVGRGVIKAIQRNADTKLVCILSRTPERVKKELANAVSVFAADNLDELKKADVAILCSGSKDDLPVQGPFYAKYINTVDSYDNHSQALSYFNAMDKVAREAGTVACVSTGWDPGIFSLQRVLGNAFIPGCKTYGFYGIGPKGGLSMGHSDAIRRIAGVQDARQYTHAIAEAIESVRSGRNPELKPGDMHWRECFVVVKEGADTNEIEHKIKTMEGYFAPYKTVVHFVSQEELDAKCSGFPHDGLVVGSGITGEGNRAHIEYSNIWDSNPEATANIMVAHARAVKRLAEENRRGAFTIFDIPPAYFSSHSREELIRSFL